MRPQLNISILLLGLFLMASCNGLTHFEAKQLLDKAGIRIQSTTSCSNRANKLCTSLDGVRQETIDFLINFRKTTPRCRIIVSGGTEVGHGDQDGVDTHEGGYKLDLKLGWCINRFIKIGAKTDENPNFRFVENVEQTYPSNKKKYNAPLYRHKSGAYFLKQYNQWDVLYPQNPVPNWE